ncbi:acyl-CoA dehydrogenase family protein [Dermatobacter hominis]|uniref:acyl-CoA dehydrogenase family protein n=1 Tax=Dermatobacter hominis TaxID=2884263 RepID=UPI001D1008FC|nr:acyl-CoA dehydrogenase family protein [Dermatobacter hominis]UDY34216.1 acyl-CoA/acyl-ACP dehydrogenase [Dermatobacter hominis]
MDTITAPDTTGLDTELLAELSTLDAAHDRDGTYVADEVDLLRSRGWLALPVPAELGGAGLAIRDVVERQRVLAAAAPNVALVTSMHHHVVLATAWRWRHGADAAATMLRRVAEEGLFVASTGGGDFTAPQGTAFPVEGGWQVSGRKRFVSGALSAGAMNTWVLDGSTGGAEAIAAAIPMSAEGVHVEETWDSMGLRGTGSHDVVLTDVFVPDAAVAARRPLGEIHPSIQAVAAHAFPVIMAVYLGIADRARAEAVALLAERPGASDDPGTQRLVGEVDQQLATADWVLRGLVDELGDDVAPTPAQFTRVMLAKRSITGSVRAAADRMMEAVGGAAYSRRLPLERALRDLWGAPFHPLTGEQTLRIGGAAAMGLDPALGL